MVPIVSPLLFLNIGCGSRFHPDWTNIDFSSSSPHVYQYDVRQGLPFPDSSFDVLYHSHVLEHFSRQTAVFFINECHRVLKPHGILRVAVPDLEVIISLYTTCLKNALDGKPEAHDNYEWIMLELFDQTVRERPGGEMGPYLSRPALTNKEFIFSRLGGEARRIMNALRKAQTAEIPRKKPFSLSSLYSRVYESILRLIMSPGDYHDLRCGRFRTGGEVHKWMYDRYSLGNLLRQCHFSDCRVMQPGESAIPDMKKFGLEREPDGAVYKPDSLFMEAVKKSQENEEGANHGF